MIVAECVLGMLDTRHNQRTFKTRCIAHAPVGFFHLATYNLYRAGLAHEPLDDLDGHGAENCPGSKVGYAS